MSECLYVRPEHACMRESERKRARVREGKVHWLDPNAAQQYDAKKREEAEAKKRQQEAERKQAEKRRQEQEQANFQINRQRSKKQKVHHELLHAVAPFGAPAYSLSRDFVQSTLANKRGWNFFGFGGPSPEDAAYAHVSPGGCTTGTASTCGSYSLCKSVV